MDFVDFSQIAPLLPNSKIGITAISKMKPIYDIYYSMHIHGHINFKCSCLTQRKINLS
jgi:hypothetical protein